MSDFDLHDINLIIEEVLKIKCFVKHYKSDLAWRQDAIMINLDYETWKDAIAYFEDLDKDVSKKLQQVLIYGVSFLIAEVFPKIYV